MQHPFLIGEKLYLRAIEREDLSGAYFQWLNDPEVTRYMETGRFPNTPGRMERYFDAKTDGDADVMLMVVLREQDRAVGTIKLGDIDWIHRHAEYGIMIGAKDAWGQGFGTEAGRLLLDYAFRRLNLHLVHLGLVADHTSAIRSYEKLGFRKAGALTDYYFVDGAYRDKLLMSVTREAYLSGRKGTIS